MRIETLELDDWMAKYLSSQLLKSKHFSRLILSFHGYGERAESQFQRMEDLSLADDTLVLCPQALHGFEIEDRTESTQYSEEQKMGWSWMNTKTRNRDILLNKHYMLKLIDELKSYEISWDQLVIMGHSQGASHAWRTASWIGCDEIILHAGDIPPELRKQWSPKLRESNPHILLGRAFSDNIYSELVFKRDLEVLQMLCDDQSWKTWQGEGNHQWQGAWVDFLKQHLNSSVNKISPFSQKAS